MPKKTEEELNSYGVDAPITRLALIQIYLTTGMLPKGFDESWKQKIPFEEKK